jgi:hypothetical protein
MFKYYRYSCRKKSYKMIFYNLFRKRKNQEGKNTCYNQFSLLDLCSIQRRMSRISYVDGIITPFFHTSFFDIFMFPKGLSYSPSFSFWEIHYSQRPKTLDKFSSEIACPFPEEIFYGQEIPSEFLIFTPFGVSNYGIKTIQSNIF